MDGGGKNFWVIANFKSKKNLAATLEWIDSVGSSLNRDNLLKVVVCPSFVSLAEAKKRIQVNNYPLLLGSQDLSTFPPGAYTGEEPAEHLKDLIDIAIIGHSERRTNFKEDEKLLGSKVTQAVGSGIKPLFCVQSQDTPIPENCVLIAYEPVFAIGTGTPDTPENANSVALQIKKKLNRDVEILYGGSVTSKNIKDFLKCENISGVLVGTASLDSQEFLNILSSC